MPTFTLPLASLQVVTAGGGTAGNTLGVTAFRQPGVKSVYEKNTDYMPRKEPASWTSGGKVVKVDRVEWITMPDAQTAVNALQAGDIDFM